MAGPYKITDEFDGRTLFQSYRLTLAAMRRKALEFANQQGSAVVLTNTKTNCLVDVIKPTEPDYGSNLARDAHHNPEKWHQAMWPTKD